MEDLHEFLATGLSRYGENGGEFCPNDARSGLNYREGEEK